MKTISELLIEWQTMKANEPKGGAISYSQKLMFWNEQNRILRELDDAGCFEIPGEPLPVWLLLQQREDLMHALHVR